MNFLLQINPLYQIYIGMALFIFSVLFIIFSLKREKALSDERLSELHTNNIHKKNSLLREQKKDILNPVFSRLPDSLNIPILVKQAGLTSQTNFFTFMAVFLPLLGFVLTLGVTKNFTTSMILLFLVLGLIYFYLLFLKKKRLKEFEDELPQALEIISRSLRAGHPFMSGVEMVSKEMPEPIRSEFEAIFNEQKIGIPLKNSLFDMTQRIPLTDLRFFVISVLIHRQVGGDLGEILTNISFVIRDRIKILRQVKAITAAGRLSGWVMCLVPAFIFFVVSIFNPEHTNTLLHHELGRKILYSAICLQILGMISIRKIVNIKV